jgi:ATP-dependent Clp protease ATP-binding subunit ClpC
MYERFTDRARKVMQLANQEAQRFCHDYIGTEHILLGLVKEGSGVAANVLKNLDIDLRKIRLEVEKMVQSGPEMVTMGSLPQTPRAKKVLEYATAEGRSLNHNYIGTEHLLLGLLCEQEGLAAQILMNLGLNLDNVRKEVLNLLGVSQPMSKIIEGTGTEHKAQLAMEKAGRNLTELARERKLLPAVAWTDEIERLIRILSCYSRSNPLLLGARGYCRTAIVEGLAQLLIGSDVPAWLKDTTIVDMGNSWREYSRLVSTLGQAAQSPRTILFIDDFSLTGAVDELLSQLTLSLARGEVRLIAATTPEEYRNYLYKNGVLERWLQPVAVRPPARAEVLAILRSLLPVLAGHHKVHIQDDALEAAIELSDRHLGGSQPDKALDVLDEAAALVRLNAWANPPQLRDLDGQLNQLHRDKQAAVAEQHFYWAAHLDEQAEALKEKKESLLKEWREAARTPDLVGVDAVTEVVKRRHGAATPATPQPLV